MALSETILPEFDHEMANTRKTLERLPEDKLGWKPHDKSWSMKELATHLANIPSWTVLTVNEDFFDMAPKDAPPPKIPEVATKNEMTPREFKRLCKTRAGKS